MTNSKICYRLSGFSDPTLSPKRWNTLLERSKSNVVFLTWHWQKLWWDVFGRGELLVIVAENHDQAIAIAPLFAEYGRIYFIGSGGSDYLDFIGDPDELILEGLLNFAAQQVSDFEGFQFYHIPEDSGTPAHLQSVSGKMGWKVFPEGGWTCPILEISRYPEQAIASTRKKSLLRHEAYFQRNGNLQVEHLQKTEEILPHLTDFFEQHISRWAPTRYVSSFLDERHQMFFSELAKSASETGWIRFTRVLWNGEVVAFHFGFHYKGRFLWYKPAFAIAFAKHSPGEVLLRQLILQSLREQANVFDFGLGDEAFKDRFATARNVVGNWGLYKPAHNKVLVMSPHPDDESIGCGGTIRKHIVEGDTVEVIFLTSGEHGGIGKTPDSTTLRIREEESKKAAAILDVPGICFWREPDGKLQVTESIVSKLIDKIRDFEPNIIYAPHENEAHPDHKAAAQIVKKALSLLPASLHKGLSVFMYEVWTPIQKFEHVVDITPYVEIKRNAIAAYESQCSLVKFQDAILGLNRYRGEMHSWPGGDYAEIFQKLKE